MRFQGAMFYLTIDDTRACEVIRYQVGELVRSSVEETLNSLLDAEADRIYIYRSG